MVQFSWSAAIMRGVMVWAPCASTTSCRAPFRCTGRSMPFKRANRFAKNGLSDVPGVLSIFCAPPVLRTHQRVYGTRSKSLAIDARMQCMAFAIETGGWLVQHGPNSSVRPEVGEGGNISDSGRSIYSIAPGAPSGALRPA